MRVVAVLLFLCGVLSVLIAASADNNNLPDIPEVRGAFTLTAVHDSATGHNAFAYKGSTVPPLIRVSPGGAITLRYVNNLPAHSDEQCALAPCMNMSNLHFHGLHVSPQRPQDDVLTMMASPGDSLSYKVEVPSYASPGLYWYHTHPHGESARQDLDGMSGAIIVDGIDRYYPELRQMRERVLVLRDSNIERMDDANRQQILQRVEVPPSPCGTSTEQNVERVFTVNGEIRPRIAIAPGERQFWCIVNASPDRYADLQLAGESFEIVALDGMPLSYHDRNRSTRKLEHILLSPAGRVEAIVTGPASGSGTTLSSRCVDTGRGGDPNPAMVLADVVSTTESNAPRQGHNVPTASGAPVYKEIPVETIAHLEAAPPDFTVIFTEDKNGFYINGKKFAMDADPMLRVRVGSIQHWRVVNATDELHPFHIHQVHFLAYAENDARAETPEWLDTVNVPVAGTVDLIMDFTDPIIRGMSLFHCHLLSHEDKGMMAKVLFE